MVTLFHRRERGARREEYIKNKSHTIITKVLSIVYRKTDTSGTVKNFIKTSQKNLTTEITESKFNPKNSVNLTPYIFYR
jgi:hypothetical protein